MSSIPAHKRLESSISSLQRCQILLDASANKVSEATNDLPQLKTILKNKKVFTVVSESDVIFRKNKLRKNIEPNLLDSLEKLDIIVSKLERKKNSLKQKSDLLQLRIENTSEQYNDITNTDHSSIEHPSSTSDMSVDGVIGSSADIQRLKLLQIKKERLKYSLNRLNRN
ncbi:unnamed protein product [[Candida] boidinii]|nr:unnamed protein product [[Candida] boidinii]